MDVVIVSAYADGERSAEEYADDYYDYGGFGVGRKLAVYCFYTIWTDLDSWGENAIFQL